MASTANVIASADHQYPYVRQIIKGKYTTTANSNKVTAKSTTFYPIYFAQYGIGMPLAVAIANTNAGGYPKFIIDGSMEWATTDGSASDEQYQVVDFRKINADGTASSQYLTITLPYSSSQSSITAQILLTFEYTDDGMVMTSSINSMNNSSPTPGGVTEDFAVYAAFK